MPILKARAQGPSIRHAGVALLLCLGLATTLRAQPLADRVPADAVVYVGWLGHDVTNPGYQGSHLQGVLEAAHLEQLLNETLPKLLEKVGEKDRDAAQAIAMAKPILLPMLKHPAAIFIAKPDIAPNQQPMPKAGLICQAGADADAMTAQIKDLLKNAPDQAREMIHVARQGDAVTVTVGYPDGALANLAADKTLAGNPSFRGVLPNAVPNASMMLYVDVEQILAVASQAIDLYGNQDIQGMFGKVRDVVGLQGVKRLVISSGFDGMDWMDQAFVSAPEPRQGLVALADSTPLSEAALKSIPMTATMAGAVRFDVAKAVGGLRAAVTQLDAGAGSHVDEMFEKASTKIGMDVQKDVLDTLGSEWVYYVDPMTGGRGLGGGIMLNHLKDPAKAEAAFGKLEGLINDQLAKNIHDKDATVKFLTTTYGGTTIHYLGTPLISPAWAVKDGYLIVALFPQMVAGAADHLAANGKSILDNPDYKALRTRLGVTNANGVSFMDLPKTAPDAYPIWVAVSRLTGFADVLGIPAPAMVMPPLNKLMLHLAPAGAVSWTDKDGMHMKSIMPFPGATVIGSDPMGSIQAVAPLMIGVALPAMNKAREQAKRIGSASQLRQMGLAAFMHANTHNDAFPASLAELAKSGNLPPVIFVNPRKDRPVPPGTDPDGKWIEVHSDYVWIGAGLKSSEGPDTILAYEKPEGLTEGLQVLFADGHIEWLFMDDAKKAINAQIEKRKGPAARAE